jgi:hypothetical protein
MFLSRFFGRQSVSSSRRQRPVRRPRVENLEGRQLLSTFVDTPMIKGNHIGTSVVVERKHIGADTVAGNPSVTAFIQGNHIGTSVA